MTPAELEKHFAIFVSPVKGHLVTRYGSSPRENIGATRVVTEKTVQIAGIKKVVGSDVELSWNTEQVIPLTHREYRVYRREYDHAVSTGALKKSDAKGYLAWLALEEKLDAEKAAAAQKSAEAPQADEPQQSEEG